MNSNSNNNTLDVSSLNNKVDRLQEEIDVNNNELRNLISQMNIKNAESLNLNFESAKAMRDLRDIQQENIPYQDKEQRLKQKFELVKDFKEKSKQVYNEYRKLDKKNNILKELNRILNEQLRRATIRLVVKSYSTEATGNVSSMLNSLLGNN
jgi:hypothetical protein